MPNCTAGLKGFGRVGRCVIEANFEGGALSSDGGLLLLRQVDERTGLSKAVAQALHDPRNQELIVHEMRDLVAQRLYALCCGYEDLNDHAALRSDPLMQTAVGRSRDLGSSPTLCRLEKRATRQDVIALNRVLVDQSIASQPRAPQEFILDIDASDIPLHGDQEQRSSTPTTTATATCPSTSSAARPCWPACCAAAGSMAPGMRRPSSSSWSLGSARPGRRCGSSSGATRASVASA